MILAIVLGVTASICFALGATAQHLGIERNFAAEGTDSRAMTLKRFMRLLVTPLWIGGLALIGTGAAMHLAALSMAPLTVVQPLGILAVPFSILLANKLHGTKTTPIMWAFVALTVVGIATFTYLSAVSVAEHIEPSEVDVLKAAGVVWVIALLLVWAAVKGPQGSRSLAWAWAGAALYGCGSGFIKLLTMEWGQWSSPLFWTAAAMLALAYSAGGWMIQQAYATGPAEIVVGVMTTIDPVVAVAFGLIVLQEGRTIGLWHAVGMVAAAVAAAAGVALLSKYHPEARQRRLEATHASVVEG